MNEELPIPSEVELGDAGSPTSSTPAPSDDADVEGEAKKEGTLRGMKPSDRPKRPGGAGDSLRDERRATLHRTAYSPPPKACAIVACTVRHPCAVAAGILIPVLLMVMALLGLGLVDLELSGGEAVLDDVRTERNDAVTLADQQYAAAEEANRVVLPQSEQRAIFFFIFEAKTDNDLLGEESISRIRETTELFTENEDWPTYCQKLYPPEFYAYNLTFDKEERQASIVLPNGTSFVVDPDDYPCSMPLDITRYFYPSEPGYNGTLYSDGQGEFTSTPEITLEILMTNPLRDPAIGFAFTPAFFETGEADYIRTYVSFGAPLEGYANREDLKAEQDEAFLGWSGEFVVPLEALYNDRNSPFEFIYFGSTLIEDVFLALVARDATLAAMSIIIVLVYLRVHTRSWCLACGGFTHVLLSFPVGYFLYKIVFQIPSFFTLSFLAIFTLLGIGADDILVFVDAYRQAAFDMHPKDFANLETRMDYAFRRASSAMFTTTSTTAASFLITALTPLPSVAAFGIFAASLIIVNYLFVITWYMAIIVIYNQHFEHKRRCLFCCGGCTKPEIDDEANPELLEEKKPNLMERFYRDTYSKFVFTTHGKAILLGLSITVVSVLSYQASNLTPSTSAEQFLPEDHPLQRFVTVLNDHYSTAVDSDAVEPMTVTTVFGIAGIDREGTNRFNATDLGVPVYSDNFNAAAPDAQQALYDFCVATQANEDVVRDGGHNGAGECACYALAFAAFCNTTGVPFPIQDEQDFYGNLSVFLSDPLDGQLYSPTLARDPITGVIAYVKVECGTLIAKSGAGFYQRHQLLPIYDAWDEWITEANEDIPASLGDEAIFVADGAFVNMHTQGVYVSQAISGVLASLAVALGVMIIFTQNLVLSSIGIASMGCVVASVLGCYVTVGWEMGITESLVTMILVGVSADFNVHFLHAFATSDDLTRNGKTRTMLFEMGYTVLGGAITSLAAGMFLSFTQLQFFFKFGVSIMLLIFFSLFFANTFLTPLLAIFGPVHKGGHVPTLFRGHPRAFLGLKE